MTTVATLSIQQATETIIDYRGKTPPKSPSGVRLVTAKVVKGGQILDEPAEYIPSNYYDEWMRRGLPRKLDVLITTEAPLGEVAVLKDDARIALAQRIILLRANPQHVDPIYLFYALQSDLGQAELRARASGTTVLGIKQSELRNVRIPVFTLPIQRRIAGILSAYDDLIENSQRRIKILEEMTRRLYREWFVHFRFPGHEDCQLVDSPLGEVPEGWAAVKIGAVADVFRGRSYRSVDLCEEGGLPFLNLKCLDRDGGFRRSGLKGYSGDYKQSQIARKGDIVMAVTDMTQERRIVARVALVPTLDNEYGVISMDLVRVEPRPNIPKAFLYSFLRYSPFPDEVKHHANGANVLHLSPDRVTDYEFAQPDVELMNRYSKLTEPIFEEIDTLDNGLANLRRTRDLLLPRLLSGQIDVEALSEPAVAEP